MLSVSKCGYDNAYGEKYRNFYLQEDLQKFKENEEVLTVCGGEHCGALYNIMIIMFRQFGLKKSRELKCLYLRLWNALVKSQEMVRQIKGEHVYFTYEKEVFG